MFGQNGNYCYLCTIKLYGMDKEFLKEKLIEGLSSRDIAKLPEVTIGSKTVVYYIHLEYYIKILV